MIKVEGSPPKNDNKTIPSNSNQNSATTDQRLCKKDEDCKVEYGDYISQGLDIICDPKIFACSIREAFWSCLHFALSYLFIQITNLSWKSLTFSIHYNSLYIDR